MNGTNKGVSAPKGGTTQEDVDTLIEEACCTQAGGKINNGTCASWFDMDSNNNPTTRHEVDTEVYNQCKEAQNRNKEKVHQKSHPYQQAGFAITPYFAYAVVDDVRDWEN